MEVTLGNLLSSSTHTGKLGHLVIGFALGAGSNLHLCLDHRLMQRDGLLFFDPALLHTCLPPTLSQTILSIC